VDCFGVEPPSPVPISVEFEWCTGHLEHFNTILVMMNLRSVPDFTTGGQSKWVGSNNKNLLLLYRNNRFDRCTTFLGQKHSSIETRGQSIALKFDTKREFRERHDEENAEVSALKPHRQMGMHREGTHEAKSHFSL
jgi:hypothetical protein